LKLKHTDKGHFAEQLGMAWLLKNDYWVFKNLAPQGPIDCVAVNKTTNQTTLVDIKTVSWHKNGYVRSRTLTDEQKKLNVKILYVDTDNFSCRWRDNRDDINIKRNQSGQFLRKKFS
jgi:Holliday junction resolvase-like predicted endonuclease